MIHIKNVYIQLGKKIVLNDLSCTIDAGDFVAIVGPNGAGKTTFFDIIAGRQVPSQGSITINRQDITDQSELQRAHLISRLFQNPLQNCVPSMTVAENIALALLKHNRTTLSRGINSIVLNKVTEIAQLLDLDRDTLAQTQMGDLSGGQRQTIALVMATLTNPQILLLDEPTAALDPQAATKMLCFMMAHIKRHNLTTILITHDPKLALTIADKIWLLEKGIFSKQICTQDKKVVSAQDLMGHIDYQKIARISHT